MEKINIKELAKNLKNMNTTSSQPVVTELPPVVEEKKEVIIKPLKVVEKPKVEKSINEEPKPVKEKPQKETIIASKPQKDPLEAKLLAEAAQYDFTKQVWIDAELYEVLVHIKRRKKIPNMSVLVTSIIESYINENRDSVAQLFDSKWVKK